MQIRISDLMDKSCPDEVELGAADKVMTRRVNDAVMAKLGITQPKPRRTAKKTLRTLLLVAVIAALMGTAAYAASGWFMNLRKTGTAETGYWRELDEQGEILNEHKASFPDAGMVLTFEGPAERRNQPEFRCFYLPSEPNFGFTDAEGWTTFTIAGFAASTPSLMSSSTK